MLQKSLHKSKRTATKRGRIFTSHHEDDGYATLEVCGICVLSEYGEHRRFDKGRSGEWWGWTQGFDKQDEVFKAPCRSLWPYDKVNKQSKVILKSSWYVLSDKEDRRTDPHRVTPRAPVRAKKQDEVILGFNGLTLNQLELHLIERDVKEHYVKNRNNQGLTKILVTSNSPFH